MTAAHKLKDIQSEVCYEWALLPVDILQQIGSLLHDADKAAARLACCAWRVGISFGVTLLRPRTVPNGGALSAALGSAPAQLQAFPNLLTLDLRRTSISPFQLPALRGLVPSVKLLQLTYLERINRPYEYFQQLQELYHGLGKLATRMRCELELHVNEARSFMLSDRDLEQIVDAPLAVDITSLHVSHQLSYSISSAGLACLTRLSALRSLSLVTYSADLDDFSFSEFSALRSLQQLQVGIVPLVTGEGFAAGLATMTQLTDLTLVACSRLDNRGVGLLVDAAPRLTSLTLIKCPWLTDSAFKHLLRLQRLASLSMDNNDNIRPGQSYAFVIWETTQLCQRLFNAAVAGVAARVGGGCRQTAVGAPEPCVDPLTRSYAGGLARLQSLASLRQLTIKRFKRFGPEDSEALLQAENIEQVNDRCKLVACPTATRRSSVDI